MSESGVMKEALDGEECFAAAEPGSEASREIVALARISHESTIPLDFYQ